MNISQLMPRPCARAYPPYPHPPYPPYPLPTHLYHPQSKTDRIARSPNSNLTAISIPSPQTPASTPRTWPTTAARAPRRSWGTRGEGRCRGCTRTGGRSPSRCGVVLCGRGCVLCCGVCHVSACCVSRLAVVLVSLPPTRVIYPDTCALTHSSRRRVTQLF